MIANTKEGPMEVFFKVITSPLWGPIFLTYLGWRKAAGVFVKLKRAEHTPSWMPANEIERSVYAALIIAGEPVNNSRLAELMGCSPGEASKRVARLEGAIRKTRKGREVLISLH